MILKYFNTVGSEKFDDFLSRWNHGSASLDELEPIRRDTMNITTFDNDIDFQFSRMPSKRELAKSVCDAFQKAGYRDLPLDPTPRVLGMWSWLAALTFEVVRGRPNLGAKHYYVLTVDTPRLWNRMLTHRLAGPARIYWLFRDRPLDASLFLSGVAYQRSSDMNEFVTRKDFLLNRPLMTVANRLYYNPIGARAKRGRHGDSPNSGGTIPRFVAVMRQFQQTYDLESMTPDQILDLLPPEFDRWKDS